MALIDKFGREVNYMRMSVTDRCDFRCVYCMAEEMTFLPKARLLTMEEMAAIARCFAELNFNVSVDYDIALGDAGVLPLHMDSNFVDEQHFNIFNTEAIKGDDYWVSNARISFESADSSYTLAAWVKNIEDKTYVTQSIDLSPLGFDYFQLGAPRMAGVEATFRF